MVCVWRRRCASHEKTFKHWRQWAVVVVVLLFLFFQTFRDLFDFFLTSVVNFINILCTIFSYEHYFGSFSLVTCTYKKLPKWCLYETFVRKMLKKLTPVFFFVVVVVLTVSLTSTKGLWLRLSRRLATWRFKLLRLLKTLEHAAHYVEHKSI